MGKQKENNTLILRAQGSVNWLFSHHLPRTLVTGFWLLSPVEFRHHLRVTTSCVARPWVTSAFLSPWIRYIPQPQTRTFYMTAADPGGIPQIQNLANSMSSVSALWDVCERCKSRKDIGPSPQKNLKIHGGAKSYIY